jgi:hypothetical protein
VNADQIRSELQGLAQVRAGLEADLSQARDDSAGLLGKALDAGITMSEAARLLGVSRVSAYELLKRIS